MKRTVWLSVACLLGLILGACEGDPAQRACDKVKECGGYDEDTTEADCKKEFEEIPEDRREDCADCLEDHSCEEIDKGDACKSACDDK
jgi:hypothetical protein